MAYKQRSPIIVAEGGTGVQSNTAYAVLCGGTTSTNPIQSIASVGNAGEVLTSNGAGALPTFQPAAGGGITSIEGNSGGPQTGPAIVLQGDTTTSGASVTFVGSANTITLDLMNGTNMFLGTLAGNTTLTGSNNTGIGSLNLQSLTNGSGNIALGNTCGISLTTGVDNVLIGSGVGSLLTDGLRNVAIGATALSAATIAEENTAIGVSTLSGLIDGTRNVAFGYQAGSSLTGSESRNILIANNGVAAESNTTRLGTEGNQTTCYLAGNVITTSSATGTTRTLLVQNTSTSSSSNSGIIAEVANTADAYYQSRIASGQNWTWGLDNSDSDAYALSASATLGTTNVMRASTAGEINYPLQPAFLAWASDVSNVTGNGTGYTVIFNNEIFDQNSDFNTGTSTFTAPVTGRYAFQVSVLFSDLTASFNTVDVNLLTTNSSYRSGSNNIGTVRNNTNQAGYGFSVLANMTAGDTATVAVAVGGSTQTVDILGVSSNDRRTFFSGYLVA